MLRADGVQVSQSSVYRALRRRGMLQPTNYHAERRALAQARKQAFVTAPRRRNRVWQTDFTRVEITSGAAWWVCPVTDYYAKVCLAAAASTTLAARDAVGALRAAIESAETMIGRSLLEDCLDPDTGELTPLIVVSDNGAAYKSADFARFIAGRPELRHVRTRHHAPETNGVVERFNESLKYEHLYRIEIPHGQALIDEVEGYRDVFNRIRPHENLDFRRPLDVYLEAPSYDVSPASGVHES